MDDGAAQRRRARAAWPMRRIALGDEDRLIVPGTPSERVAMVHALTEDAWAMTGKRMPEYSRRSSPGLLRKAPR